MLDEHPKTLAEIKAGGEKDRIPPDVLSKRRTIFFPVCGLAVAVMLAGVYFFVGYEKTALSTLPPAEDVTVFVHLTPTPLPTVPPPPTLTPAPVTATEEEATWENRIAGLLNEKCVSCHNSTLALGDLDLSSYQAAMAGGASGPAIVPAEAHTSLLISRQASGDHPGQFSPEELELVLHWIELGAPEN